jgi:aldose 1-epimerase
MALPLTSRNFGFLPNGKSVEAWTLCGSGGLLVEVITYGATITRLLAPDRYGRLADVVLGFDKLDTYLASHDYFGAIIGRVAGRITGARFNLDGNSYKLSQNDGANHLHGGVMGFDKRIWAATPIDHPSGACSLRLDYQSPDGEEVYPGTVDVSVTYTVTFDNVLLLQTEATTDRPSPFSLTQHSYFNLAGEGAGSIEDHELEVYSDEFVLTDDRMTLLGQVRSVGEGGNDFRQPRSLSEAMPLLFQNHGDLYLVRRGARGGLDSSLVSAARLVHHGSGRVLAVSTTETHLQLYTGTALDGAFAGKSGVPYVRHAGVCLECEGYPDGANSSSLGDIILRPEHSRRQTTAYAFSSLANRGNGRHRIMADTRSTRSL